MESVRDREEVAADDWPPIPPMVTRGVEIEHIWDIPRKYRDTPVGELFLRPGQRLVVDANVVEWFISQRKEYDGCCGAGRVTRHFFRIP